MRPVPKRSILIFGITFLFLLSVSSFALAANNGVGKGGVPQALAELQQENAELRTLIAGLQTQLNNIQLIPGPPGTNGTDGADGEDGAIGPIGPIGLTGSAGADGADGANGTDGNDGVDGADGADGQDGTNGGVDLTAEVTALENLLVGVSRTGDTLVFDSMNLQVRSGSGGSVTPVNGLGNLIIGYNENMDTSIATSQKTGSHNLIIGRGHNYTSFGGIVTGGWNQSLAPMASVISSYRSIASGVRSNVTSALDSVASGTSSNVTGLVNTASGDYSSVTGGVKNTASGPISSVTGGNEGVASGSLSSITGGVKNTASGNDSSVSGGINNVALGSQSSVVGGNGNTAIALESSILGGLSNTTKLGDLRSVVLGGNNITSSGGHNSISP